MSTTDILTARASGKFIAENAKHIKIHEAGIKRLGDEIVKQINNGELSVDLFSQASVHPKSSDPWALDWLFVVDTLNFCFWSKEHEPGWTVEGYTGYFALCAAINRAMKDNIDILNPVWYSKITQDQAKQVLRSDNKIEIPLLEERIKSLHQVGEILLQKFDGSFVNVAKMAEKSAKKLLQLIVNNFPCFRDEADYKGKHVALYKRAQILVGDIWACYRGKGIGEFYDIDDITMFADYRIPQSLLDFGVFEYDQELLNKLNKKELLSNGDEMEVEIRGCSIHAVELVKAYANSQLPEERKANAILIDHFLWDYRRKHSQEVLKKGLPFHKTYCIYY